MSEQQAEQTSAESGSVERRPGRSPFVATPSQPVAAAPDLVPGQGADAGADAPKAETAKVEAAPKAEAPKELRGGPKVEVPRPRRRAFPGKLMIMSAGDAAGTTMARVRKRNPSRARDMFGKRRLSAMAAMVALAVVAGALGGALATAGLSHFVGGDVASADSRALEASVARIDADILALKAGVEHTSKLGIAQFNKTSDRLDKVEKAQAEPAAKLAKLSEAVDKLRATPPAAVPVAAAAAALEGSHRLDCAPASSGPRPRPRSKWEGCRRWKAGCCAMSPMAAR